MRADHHAQGAETRKKSLELASVKNPNLTSVVSILKDLPLKRAYFVLATEYSYISTNTMKILNMFLNPKSFLVPWKIITIISFQSLTTTNRISVPIVLPFLKCRVHWIIQHAVFYVWLLPLSIRLPKFIYTVALSEVHLFLLLSRNLSQRWVKVYVIYLPAEGHFGCLHFGWLWTNLLDHSCTGLSYVQTCAFISRSHKVHIYFTF